MRAWIGMAVLVAGGATMAACSGTPGGPTAPSAAAGGSVTAASDGSTLKTPAPRLVSPLGGASVAATPTLVVEPTVGRYTTLIVRTARFQLSESAAFTTITDEGTATGAVNGLITYTVQRAQGAGRRIYWRARAELDGAVSPWSATAEFVVSGSAPTHHRAPTARPIHRPVSVCRCPTCATRLRSGRRSGRTSSRRSSARSGSST